MTPEFQAWPKIPRWNRPVTITEKIDGTNACVVVHEGRAYAQSRKRFVTVGDDNFGFAAWVMENYEDLLTLGEGYHYGEWYGLGIQRGYGLDHKRFALFNVDRWGDEDSGHPAPACCDVVPVLGRCAMQHASDAIAYWVSELRRHGSTIPAANGFAKPEGVVIYQHAARQLHKVLLEGDELPKGVAA